MSTAQYERHVSRLKQDCSKVTSESRIVLCRHLRQLEDKPRLWTPFFAAFGDFIEEHLFCDPAVYKHFRVADTSLGTRVVNRIGFWAATRVATVENRSLQAKLVDHMSEWVDGLEGAHPSYQAVDEWLRHNYPKLVPPKEPSDKTLSLQAERDLYKRSYDRLRRENTTLEAANAKLRKENNRLRRSNTKLRKEVAAYQAN